MKREKRDKYLKGIEVIEQLYKNLYNLPNYERLLILEECSAYLEGLNKELKKTIAEKDISILKKVEELIIVFRRYQTDENNFEEGQRKLFELKKYIINIKTQYEIVFLPYKASMWDAFDSIYKTVIEDEDVQVKVVPIPYYSMDKMTGAMHRQYEGNHYPDYVDVTYYEDYDLEEHPDVLFIHNPYDNMNRVTQVDSRYFSSNLNKYTEHLVYIPYDIVSHSKIDIHFCLAPGVKNAWKVFVQSDDVRNEYIKYNCADKIVAMGSPKIDAILNIKDVWKRTPVEWKEKCFGKKLFLYNTHLNGIMNESMLQLQRIEEIYRFFEKNREIALLWRPHPLSIQTAQAMNPEFLHDYLCLIQKMKELPNVIYDDTPDLNRSITISDGYIGDQSSLTLLYALTGKPLLLHSAENRGITDKERGLLVSLSGAIVNGYLWTCYDFRNGLFRVNLIDGMAEFVSEIPEIGALAELSFFSTIKWRDKLFFIPLTANCIVCYDIKVSRFVIKEFELFKGDANFQEPIVLEDKIYLFPMKYQEDVIVVDLETMEVKSLRVDYSRYSRYINNIDQHIFGAYGTVSEEGIWISFAQENAVLKISSKGEKIYTVDMQGSGIRGIRFDGLDFWIIPNIGTELVCWNRERGIIHRIDCNDIMQGNGKYIIEDVVFYNADIWVIPKKSKYIVKYNKVTHELKRIVLPEKFYEEFKNYEEKFYGKSIEDHYLYLFQYRSGNMVKIDFETEEIILQPVYLPKECDEKWQTEQRYDLKSIEVNSRKPEQFFYKDTTCSLKRFVEIVEMYSAKEIKAQKKVFKNMSLNIDGNAGQKIWKYIKNRL